MRKSRKEEGEKSRKETERPEHNEKLAQGMSQEPLRLINSLLNSLLNQPRSPKNICGTHPGRRESIFTARRLRGSSPSPRAEISRGKSGAKKAREGGRCIWAGHSTIYGTYRWRRAEGSRQLPLPRPTREQTSQPYADKAHQHHRSSRKERQEKKIKKKSRVKARAILRHRPYRKRLAAKLSSNAILVVRAAQLPRTRAVVTEGVPQRGDHGGCATRPRTQSGV
jgi:hypothetical protein